MNPGDAHHLKAAYQRESASLLRYLRDASLYVGRDRDLYAIIKRQAEEHSQQLEHLASLLTASRLTFPQSGAYPSHMTDLNFVSVRSVVPKLRSAYRDQIATLNADSATVVDPVARELLQRIVATHRKHLEELDALSV